MATGVLANVQSGPYPTAAATLLPLLQRCLLLIKIRAGVRCTNQIPREHRCCLKPKLRGANAASL